MSAKGDRPFIVYALPRSRTAWLSAFLSYRDWACAHDQAIVMRSFADMRLFFARRETGTVETGASPAWRLVKAACPEIRQAVILRPVTEVIESYRAIDVSAVAVFDWPRLERNLAYMDRCLRQIAAQPGVLAINFAELERPDACAALFEHCLPYAFDAAWWADLSRRNIQIDVVEQLRYCLRHRPEINALKSALWRELRSLARQGQLHDQGIAA